MKVGFPAFHIIHSRRGGGFGHVHDVQFLKPSPAMTMVMVMTKERKAEKGGKRFLYESVRGRNECDVREKGPNEVGAGLWDVSLCHRLSTFPPTLGSISLAGRP